MSVTPGMREFGGLGDQLAAIRTRLDKLELQRRLESASIGSGGLTIKDGGNVTVDGGGDFNVEGGGGINVNSGGDIFLTGEMTVKNTSLDKGIILSADIFDATFIGIQWKDIGGAGGTTGTIHQTSTLSTIHIEDGGGTKLSVGTAEGVEITGPGDVNLLLPKHTTTGSAANAHLQSADGKLLRSTSSLKYKTDWGWAEDVADIDLPTPIRWTDERGQARLGFGAEHVHEAVPEAYEDEIYDLRTLVAILSEKVKRLEAAWT